MLGNSEGGVGLVWFLLIEWCRTHVKRRSDDRVSERATERSSERSSDRLVERLSDRGIERSIGVGAYLKLQKSICDADWCVGYDFARIVFPRSILFLMLKSN